MLHSTASHLATQPHTTHYIPPPLRCCRPFHHLLLHQPMNVVVHRACVLYLCVYACVCTYLCVCLCLYCARESRIFSVNIMTHLQESLFTTHLFVVTQQCWRVFFAPCRLYTCMQKPFVTSSITNSAFAAASTQIGKKRIHKGKDRGGPGKRGHLAFLRI